MPNPETSFKVTKKGALRNGTYCYAYTITKIPDNGAKVHFQGTFDQCADWISDELNKPIIKEENDAAQLGLFPDEV